MCSGRVLTGRPREVNDRDSSCCYDSGRTPLRATVSKVVNAARRVKQAHASSIDASRLESSPEHFGGQRPESDATRRCRCQSRAQRGLSMFCSATVASSSAILLESNRSTPADQTRRFHGLCFYGRSLLSSWRIPPLHRNVNFDSLLNPTLVRRSAPSSLQ